MGILNDAIRQHLELKRLHGARDDEIQELEDEAFGPPSRPGDPEFGEPEPDQNLGEDYPDDDDRSDPAERDYPKGTFLETGETPASAMEPADLPAPDPESADPETETEASPAQRARDAYPNLGDTALHDALPEEEPEGELTGELEVDDIDLSLDDEPDGEADEPGEESSGLVDWEDEADPADEETAEPEGADDDGPDDPAAESPESGDDAGDLLDQTPDFLREAPEGDRLWFEQGAPRDFDFDDEDD